MQRKAALSNEAKYCTPPKAALATFYGIGFVHSYLYSFIFNGLYNNIGLFQDSSLLSYTGNFYKFTIVQCLL